MTDISKTIELAVRLECMAHVHRQLSVALEIHDEEDHAVAMLVQGLI